MNQYLLDTNVISELPRRNPNQGAIDFLESLDEIVISAVTVDEIEFGIQRTEKKQKQMLLKWWNALLSIPPIIIPVDETVAKTAGRLRAKEESRGRRMTQADALIAASALSTGRILVTRNWKDFKNSGVGLLNPFTGERG